MKTYLNKITQGFSLSAEESKTLMSRIGEGQYNDIEIAALLSGLNTKGVNLDELTGFREALLSLCKKVDLEGRETIDLCGTGGDGKDTFNISTLASFVVAGAGYSVTKHGNYGVSSVCGSSNVMEELGVTFSDNNEGVIKQLDKAGICFIHAPKFHPAMANVGNVRRQLGVKTIFNMLGPLVNPARPKHQLTGVFSLKLARLYKHIKQNENTNFTVVFDHNGYDEVSLTGSSRIIGSHMEGDFSPSHFGFNEILPTSIIGGNDVQSSAKIFLSILNNEGTAEQENVVIANASLAIRSFNPEMSLLDAVGEAKDSLKSKKALEKLNLLKN